MEDNDEPLQEIFSETQRYGRVSRYELRPGRYGQGARSANVLGEDRANSPVRRSSEFSLVRKVWIHDILGLAMAIDQLIDTVSCKAQRLACYVITRSSSSY